MSRYDVVVVGGGGAGLMAAAAAAEAGAGVAIVCKEPVGYGNTRMAVGLTACAGLPGDTYETFIDNLLASGEGLSSCELVETLVRDSRKALTFLEGLGHTFKRNAEGQLSESAITRAGGHSRPRTLQSSGAGIGLAQSLRAAAAKYQIDLLEDTLVLELLKADDRVSGVRLLDMVTGEEYSISAGAVVLATGGGSWLFYPQTSNNRGSTGDGYALAFRAGAELMDMEQIQALPFAVTHPGAYRGLICGEPVVAGPAGKLTDNQGNTVLAGGIHKMDRASVVRAMADPITAGRVAEHGGVFLDLRPNLHSGTAYRDQIRSTGITDTVLPAYGKKAFDWEEPWEVLPTAHFFMGGIKADSHGATAVGGLYAAGEAMGGVHGANRLGSAALTEILVFGQRAGQAAALWAKSRYRPEPKGRSRSRVIGMTGTMRPIQLCRRLQNLMWQTAGLVRDRAGLLAALETVEELIKEASDLSVCAEPVYNMELRDARELDFMLLTAKLVLTSALLREESRGAHLRSDFPESGGKDFEKNIILWQDQNGKIAYKLKEPGQ
jgi:succinate dehydrogenase/fumarate reductase flavoprotein subunit